jgi:hypothetical protein
VDEGTSPFGMVNSFGLLELLFTHTHTTSTTQPIASPSHIFCCPLTCCFNSLLTFYLFGNLLHTHTHRTHTPRAWTWKHEHKLLEIYMLHTLETWIVETWTPWTISTMNTLETRASLHPHLGDFRIVTLIPWKLKHEPKIENLQISKI